MLIDVNTIPNWIVRATKLPKQLLGPRDGCDGADFTYCIRTAMSEDIKWQEELELKVDTALLIERKWYRIWFVKQHFIWPGTYLECMTLKCRLKCIYRRLSKNGDVRKEYVRILIRALDY